MANNALKYKLKKHKWILKHEGQNLAEDNFFSLTCNGKKMFDFDVVYIESNKEFAAYYQGYQVATLIARIK